MFLIIPYLNLIENSPTFAQTPIVQNFLAPPPSKGYQVGRDSRHQNFPLCLSFPRPFTLDENESESKHSRLLFASQLIMMAGYYNATETLMVRRQRSGIPSKPDGGLQHFKL